MKKSILILLISTIIIIHGNSQYYDFPFIGWKQTFTSYTWTGTQNQTGIVSLSFDRDTIIDGQSYISNGFTHFRSHQGKIFHLNYNWQTQSFIESLEYDFSLNIGDTVITENFSLEDSARVINKKRIINLVGDSIWQINIQFKLNSIVKDTITWIEGVGNLNSGLIKTNYPDGGLIHACTLLDNNRKTYVNYKNTDYCNCRFEYGIDMDNDGYGNYTSRIAEVYLGFHFNNPSAEKTYKVRGCDTLKVISTDLDNIYFSSMENCNGNIISIDSFSNSDIDGGILYTYYIYNIEAFDKIYLSDQCSWDFAEIYIYPCFQNDCDDNNSNINPSQIEEPYNGLDDDCSSTTLDDDLDQDGFLLSEDCNDDNPNINPVAEEIANNGVDEDCNGMDLVSSTYEICNSTINIFPNPTKNEINIDIMGNLSFEANLFDIKGKMLISQENSNKINVNTLTTGSYLLEIKDQKTGQKIVVKVIIGQ